jgi:hypothetical protein
MLSARRQSSQLAPLNDDDTINKSAAYFLSVTLLWMLFLFWVYRSRLFRTELSDEAVQAGFLQKVRAARSETVLRLRWYIPSRCHPCS